MCCCVVESPGFQLSLQQCHLRLILVPASSAEDHAQGTVNKIHSKGAVAVCYISIGTVEDWRGDAGDFPQTAIGNDVHGWAGEKWLDVNDKVMSCDDIGSFPRMTLERQFCARGICPCGVFLSSKPDSFRSLLR